MADAHLFWYQKENIEKLLDKIMNIDFSNIHEVTHLRRKLIEEISKNIDFHMELHAGLEDFHDCKEFESKTNFGRKMIRILDETIEELRS